MAKIRELGMNNEQGCENIVMCCSLKKFGNVRKEEGKSVVGGTCNAERVFFVIIIGDLCCFSYGRIIICL